MFVLAMYMQTILVMRTPPSSKILKVDSNVSAIKEFYCTLNIHA